MSLVKTHGPEHIIFGTDWSWFSPVTELKIITGLLVECADQDALESLRQALLASFDKQVFLSP